MTTAINPGDTFTIRRTEIVGRKRYERVDMFRRHQDDPNPTFSCERIVIEHVSCSANPEHRPYRFGAEPEWFRQRGIKLEEESRP